jgi:hypothetical protein
MRKKKNEIMSVECACGELCGITADIMQKMGWNSVPEFLDCSECPVCTPELLDTPEDHEDEAYAEDVDLDELEESLQKELFSDDDDDFDEFDSEEDFDEFVR